MSERRIALVQSVDGKQFGAHVDPDTSEFYPPKKGAHFACMHPDTTEFYMYCCPETTAQYPTLERLCMVCETPLVGLRE
jgi:hypothetical protein